MGKEQHFKPPPLNEFQQKMLQKYPSVNHSGSVCLSTDGGVARSAPYTLNPNARSATPEEIRRVLGNR